MFWGWGTCFTKPLGSISTIIKDVFSSADVSWFGSDEFDDGGGGLGKLQESWLMSIALCCNENMPHFRKPVFYQCHSHRHPWLFEQFCNIAHRCNLVCRRFVKAGIRQNFELPAVKFIFMCISQVILL